MNDKCKCGAKLKYNSVEETENFERYETLDCIKCGYHFDYLESENPHVLEVALEIDMEKYEPPKEVTYNVTFQAVRDEEIAYFMPKGFGDIIDNSVVEQRKELLKGIRNKHNGYWVGHSMFTTLVSLGLVEDKPIARLTVRGKIFLQQGLEANK